VVSGTVIHIVTSVTESIDHRGVKQLKHMDPNVYVQSLSRSSSVSNEGETDDMKSVNDVMRMNTDRERSKFEANINSTLPRLTNTIDTNPDREPVRKMIQIANGSECVSTRLCVLWFTEIVFDYENSNSKKLILALSRSSKI